MMNKFQSISIHTGEEQDGFVLLETLVAIAIFSLVFSQLIYPNNGNSKHNFYSPVLDINNTKHTYNGNGFSIYESELESGIKFFVLRDSNLEK